ncbi:MULTISPECIES: MBL fold metallo-hydrolase [unclassified Clostridium]|uniref:MBL fold metallo-hydrolase n=1 Tax=unclassified Clostridium TaxID=2614128 RepID=UPI0002985F78|nr:MULTISPECIES: MBL fold metallo-hydrolase [unclassified Clostridium]EKQ56632.1 MAG: putative beta-lactamase fold Zn-dependent hydrolase [Clostridium sp. Maddingley MBC34-26]
MAKLFYQGHGSFRIVTNNNIVIYVDPYVGEGYDLPADIILVTHEHPDHTKLELIRQKENCRILRAESMLINGEYKHIQIRDINITSVPAYNKNHDVNKCVGYVIEVDNVKIYAAGDTSTTEYMKTNLSKQELDYALLPTDGYYNMDAKEAEKCAEIIGAKHAIPIHTKPGELFDINVANEFSPANKLIVKPGEEIELS